MVMSFTTARMKVIELESLSASIEQSTMLERIPQILTPTVVENLPPYFHNIDSVQQARAWLERMLADSRLLQIQSASGELIGFLFIYVEDNRDAHIGYLLAEEYWGKGLASELLTGFIQQALSSESWSKLIGGVDRANVASAHLLKKLGFVERSGDKGSVVFYELTLAESSITAEES